MECFEKNAFSKQWCRKLDKKSVKGYLVGYCDEKDGYHVYVPQLHNVVKSRDVVFKPEPTVINLGEISSPEVADSGKATDEAAEVESEIGSIHTDSESTT